MYILSEDRKSIIHAAVITVERNSLGLYSDKKGMKYALVAKTSGQDHGDMGYALGAYATEEEAVFELERIMSAIEAGHETYRMGQY